MKPVCIHKSCFDKIVRWSLCSRKEISFIGAGRDGVVTEVVRLRNTADDPKNYFLRNADEYRFVMKSFRGKGLRDIISGHSHPSGTHHPSRTDWKFMGDGHKELIVSITKGRATVKAWRIRASYRETLASELPLTITYA